MSSYGDSANGMITPYDTRGVGPDQYSATSDSDQTPQNSLDHKDDYGQDTDDTTRYESNFVIIEDDAMSFKASVPYDASNLKHVNPDIRFSTWGIFVIIYEATSGIFKSSSLLTTSFSVYKVPCLSYLRLVKDLWSLCKWHCIQFYTCNLWLTLGPSVSLCFATSIVFNAQKLLVPSDILKGALNNRLDGRFRCQIAGWLLCGFCTFFAERNFTESRTIIGSHLRAHFIPKLIKASLEIDRNTLDERDGPFPGSHRFADYVPGLQPFEEVLIRIRCIVAVALEVLAMGVIILSFNDPFDKYAMSCLVILFFTTTLLTPQHGAGGRAFGFVTWNEHFKRMHVLFSIAFNYEFRPALSRDGLTDWVVEEYKRASSALGIAKDIIGLLAWGPPAPWYWQLSQTVVTKYPMELSAFLVLWAPSNSIITTVILFQYAVSTLHGSISSLNGSGQRGPLILNMMTEVESLYRLLDISPDVGGSMGYPTSPTGSGTSIELKNVSYTYPAASASYPSVNRINLTIQAGQLIVITGANGSGKSTLVNLISGLLQPTSGDVMVDLNRIQLYNSGQLRKAITLISQKESIYYTSLRENLLLGTPNGPSLPVNDEDLDEAALLGGSSDLIRKHGYDAVLSPCNLPNISIIGFPGKAVIDLLNKMDHKRPITTISAGEHQRIIASRAFLRLKHGNIRLVILDESTNSLDAMAEAKVLENFRTIAKGNGQTMIVVTHRLTNIAKQADLILCMSEGRIAEQGTHQDLVTSGGEYASLYNAQTLTP